MAQFTEGLFTLSAILAMPAHRDLLLDKINLPRNAMEKEIVSMFYVHSEISNGRSLRKTVSTASAKKSHVRRTLDGMLSETGRGLTEQQTEWLQEITSYINVATFIEKFLKEFPPQKYDVSMESVEDDDLHPRPARSTVAPTVAPEPEDVLVMVMVPVNKQPNFQKAMRFLGLDVME